jgi:hypothetical protein
MNRRKSRLNIVAQQKPAGKEIVGLGLLAVFSNKTLGCGSGARFVPPLGVVLHHGPASGCHEQTANGTDGPRTLGSSGSPARISRERRQGGAGQLSGLGRQKTFTKLRHLRRDASSAAKPFSHVLDAALSVASPSNRGGTLG